MLARPPRANYAHGPGSPAWGSTRHTPAAAPPPRSSSQHIDSPPSNQKQNNLSLSPTKRERFFRPK